MTLFSSSHTNLGTNKVVKVHDVYPSKTIVGIMTNMFGILGKLCLPAD